MLKSSNKITQFIVLTSILLISLVHGQNWCGCQCNVTHSNTTDVCRVLNLVKVEVDANKDEIKYLGKKIDGNVINLIRKIDGNVGNLERKIDENVRNLERKIEDVRELRKSKQQPSTENYSTTESETSKKVQEHLGLIIADEEANTVDMQEEISSSDENVKGNILDKHLSEIDQRLDALENEKYRNLNRRLWALEAEIENYKKIGNTVSSLEKSYQNLSQLEEVVNSSLRNFSSNITKIWSSIENIEDTEQQMLRNLTESITRLQNQMDQTVKKPSFPEVNNTTSEWVVTTVAECETPHAYKVTSSAIYRGFQKITKCGDYDLSSGTAEWNQSTGNGDKLTYQQSTDNRLPPNKLFFILQTENGPDFKNECAAVRISWRLVITSRRCVGKPGVTSYKVIGDGFPERITSYVYKTESEDDIVMIWFEQPDFGVRSDVVCLPNTAMKDKLLGKATFIGWNVSEKNSKILLSEVCLMTDDACRRSYPYSYNSSMICTKHDQLVRQSCEASGGGFLFKEIENKAVLIGIVTDCGSSGKPIKYTEVSYFTSWIDSTVKKWGSSWTER